LPTGGGAIDLKTIKSFCCTTLTEDDAVNTFEPDDDNNVTVYVKHSLWSKEDDKCTLFNEVGKEKASVRISHDVMRSQHYLNQLDVILCKYERRIIFFHFFSLDFFFLFPCKLLFDKLLTKCFWSG